MRESKYAKNSTGSMAGQMNNKITIADFRKLQEGQTRGKGSRASSPKTDYKAIFLQQIQLAGLPAPTGEHQFHASRKWRLDFCWLTQKVAIEYHGIFGKHKVGHQGMAALTRDYEKANEAILLGWTYLVITAKTVQNGQALQWIERALKKSS